MNDDKKKEDYDNDIHSKQLDKKCFLPWSPLEESKFLSKHRYVSCSRSAPHKNKRFVRYKLSRSLYLDVNIHSSSSEDSSFVEDKHLSRSAKIMRALNVSSSRAYYERTKIKKSLNFNLTPSPKRFVPARKGIRKALSLSFTSPVFGSNKTLDYDDDPNDTTNSSLTFTSSESIDENQNETPSQRSTKGHRTLHYSTPNTRLSRKSLCSTSFAPVLPSRLKETIDNVMCSSTPNSHSFKYIEGRPKCLDNIATNTSRNLFHEFHGGDDDDDDDDGDGDDNRPHTPENFIRIIPESMSAIKRSHKKERSSKRSEHYATQFANVFENDAGISKNETGTVEDYDYIPIDIPVCDSEDGISDTGSLFDYTEERKHIAEDSEKVLDSILNCDSGPSKFHRYDIKGKPEPKESDENLCESQIADHNEIIEEINDVKTSSMSARYYNARTEVRSVTPDPTTEIVLKSQESITPENDINVLRSLAKDSIKKSRSKSKGDNRRKLFSPKVLQCKVEVTGEEDTKCWQDVKKEENPEDDRLVSEQSNHLERACTPENINSSRLLLSQYSSIKKSHRKDKHNKIVSGFLKRQEYFNKEVDFVRDTDNEIKVESDDGRPEYKSLGSLSSNSDAVTNVDESTSSATHVDETASLNRLSPSKRKIPLDVSLDRDTHNVSCDSELQESDASAAEEFKIFTPLKRKRSLIPSAVKENYYDLLLGKNEISDEAVANISLSRCLTPVPNFRDIYTTRIPGEKSLAAVKLDSSIASEEVPTEIHDCDDSNDTTGRLTPRNMSTVELYSNLDSIKKSHKKNKRENCSRKTFKLVRNNCCDEESQAVSKNIENVTYDKLESSDDCIGVYDTNKSIDHDDIDVDIDIERSASSRASDENLASTSTEKLLQNVTPPNSLKTRNYIKLLRETSIKRSHKKVRDQKKYDLLTAEANDLSDDGSIFGNEEKLVLTEDQSTKE
ncbi:uncharacterized protein LOC143366830 isoform X2 [Andrena cerasifolii]|uniref:uncharacterized protein LOC143366830 isoform X2 n=1 Tax=Andrena cerasifolii TaxID=2819439 RepID=UPI004037E51F